MRSWNGFMVVLALAVGCSSSTKDNDDDDGEVEAWSENGGNPSDPFGGTSGSGTSGGGTSGDGTGGGGGATGGGTGGTTGGGAGGEGGGGSTSADGIADDPFSPREGRWLRNEFSFSEDECGLVSMFGITSDTELPYLLTTVEEGFALTVSGIEPSIFVLEGRSFAGIDEIVTDYTSGGTFSGMTVPPMDAVRTLTSELSGTFSSDESAALALRTVGVCEGADCEALYEMIGISDEPCTTASTSALNWQPPPDDDTGTMGDDGSDSEDWTSSDPGDCRHPYNPIHRSGWEKTFSATWIGGTGAIATEQGMGTGYTSSGVETYKTWEKLTTAEGEGWEGSVYHGCDNSDGTRLATLEWNMMLSFAEIPSGPATALMMLSSPRIYLADPSKMGSGDSWEYSYTLTYVDTSSGSSGAGGSVSIGIPVMGTYTDGGMVEIEVLGETMDAWKIESTYNMDLLSGLGVDAASLESSGISWFTRSYPGRAEHYWVEDMGLVYEKHVDTETETVILEKTLTDMVGW